MYACLTNGIDPVSDGNRSEPDSGILHSGDQLLPLIQVGVVNLSNVDHLLLYLPTGDKDLLTQQGCSCGGQKKGKEEKQ